MGSFVWPCPSYTKVSSPFTLRRWHPVLKEYRQHTGVDLACAQGRDILAARPGTVLEAKYSKGYGNEILLDHGNGIQTRYAHASKLLVKKGAKVAVGQVIAKVGSTGLSTGAHLHFEIIVNGTPQDPLNYVSEKDTVQNYTNGNGLGVNGAQSAATAGEGAANTGGKEINDIVIKSISGDRGTRSSALLQDGKYLQRGCEIIIQNKQAYVPMLEGDIVWETERFGVPGKLTFQVVKDSLLNFQEGNPVRFLKDQKNVFYGYVFSKNRSDDRMISVTCYDQLRYLKNKSTMKYENRTYSALLKMIADDYNLAYGTIDDTGFVLKGRLEESTLYDILGNAADLTYNSTGRIYILYDDFGKLCLKDFTTMAVPVLIDANSACEFEYTSSIDQDTSNKVMLAYDNQETGKREVTIAQDAATQAQWGILQMYQKVNDGSMNLKSLAETILKVKNKKTRSLRISKALGDIRVRAGCSVLVHLSLGDVTLQNLMLVEKVTHTFSHGEHWMAMTLIGGGEFVG